MEPFFLWGGGGAGSGQEALRTPAPYIAHCTTSVHVDGAGRPTHMYVRVGGRSSFVRLLGRWGIGYRVTAAVTVRVKMITGNCVFGCRSTCAPNAGISGTAVN